MVLEDCRWAIRQHANDLSGREFRGSWLSIVTLLRAVGHVLREVDRKTSMALAAAIDAKWDEWKRGKPKPEIFWQFIQSERNSVLKVYRFGVERGLTIPGPELKGAPTSIAIDYVHANAGGSDPDATFSRLVEPAFQGRHEREVALEAVAWWQETLDDIEKRAQLGHE